MKIEPGQHNRSQARRIAQHECIFGGQRLAFVRVATPVSPSRFKESSGSGDHSLPGTNATQTFEADLRSFWTKNTPVRTFPDQQTTGYLL